MTPSRSFQGYFVTGSDTDVGKTWVSCLLLTTAQKCFRKVGAYKPVASGVDRLENSDPYQLLNAISRSENVDRICPQQFKAPLAPFIAAELEGRSISRHQILEGYQYWKESSDFLLVEGAGGLFSPLDCDYLNADLARDLGLPLIVVIESRVGAINQTLLTLQAACVYQLPVAAIVLNQACSEAFHSSQKRYPDLLNSAMHRLGLPSAPILEFAFQQDVVEVEMFQRIVGNNW
jgi:dethiobiotin synthetase